MLFVIVCKLDKIWQKMKTLTKSNFVTLEQHVQAVTFV